VKVACRFLSSLLRLRRCCAGRYRKYAGRIRILSAYLDVLNEARPTPAAKLILRGAVPAAYSGHRSGVGKIRECTATRPTGL